MAFTRTSDPPYSSALATLIPVVWRWSVKKFFFFLIKLQAETLTRVFSCQLSKIFRNIFFYRKPLVADFSRNIITSGFVFMAWQTKTAIHSTVVLKTSALKKICKIIEKHLCQRCFPEIFVNLSRKGIYRTLSGDYFGQMFLCFSYYIRHCTITIILRWNTCL